MAPDIEIAALAARQKGYVTWAQLTALGLTRHQIQCRVRRGFLIKVHRGVYAVGHLPRAPTARAGAALLACGPKAVLSHSSAAAAWGINKRWEAPFEVTAPSQHRHDGITVHRATLHARDVRIQDGLRVTSSPKTLLDMAPRMNDRQLERAVNDQRRRGFLQPNDFAETIARAAGHRGVARARPFTAEDHATPTRSELEDRFKRLCKDHGLPAPEINVVVNGYEVDALFAEERVIVELDGYAYHNDRATFESDRERDATNLEADHVTLRITEPRMTRSPDQEAARIHRILAQRR